MRGLEEIIELNRRAADAVKFDTEAVYRIGYLHGQEDRAAAQRGIRSYQEAYFNTFYARGYRAGWAEGD